MTKTLIPEMAKIWQLLGTNTINGKQKSHKKAQQ
jgi:hypothetical protein